MNLCRLTASWLNLRASLCVALFAHMLPSHCLSQDALPVTLPRVLVDGWDLDLISAEPKIVTPTACCFDAQGRLMVVECHTHFPPEGYGGPKHDRIYAFEDGTGDGRLDKQTTYYPGGTATMGIVGLPDGSTVVVSRSQVARHWDEDGNGRADRREILLRLNTKADYPHNGLGGIAIAGDGSLLIGLGENFGEPYELVAKDGSRQVGSGEGGNIFRLNADGKKLSRLATGFWNPFGICVDTSQRIWTVGNDPDAMPPCRLLHVIEGGDYGFQFRFGRGGRHPLQAWNGELPGTLPFAAGTGEAASGIAVVDGELWVTSWGDNRIEAYTPMPRGSSWGSATRVVVQGGPNFRPVGITRGSDGAVYVTDWVDRSYSVHRKGRIWRIAPKASVAERKELPEKTIAEREADRLLSSTSFTELTTALDHEDPFVRQRAVATLARDIDLMEVNPASLRSERQRAGILAAWRWRELCRPESVASEERRRLIQLALSQPDSAPISIALRWAAERDEKQLLPAIDALLESSRLQDDLFPQVIAAASYLRQGTARSGVRDTAREQALLELAGNSRLPASARRMAIRLLPSAADEPTAKRLHSWLMQTTDVDLQREIVRLLRARAGAADVDVLAAVAESDEMDKQVRADATATLDASKHQELLALLERSKSQRSKLQHSEPDVVALEAQRTNASRVDVSTHPPAEDFEAWWELMKTGGDAAAGERVFWRRSCHLCHAHSGRGATTGPALTSLGGQTRRDLLESILQPSRDIGPMYAAWQIVTSDGQVLLGLKSVTSGVGQQAKFQAADGSTFEVDLRAIESQSLATQSIMPEGLERTMTVDELRDLLAFLEQE